MFHNIPANILARMKHLEEIDARDRGDGTSRMARLRQIPPETGRLIALLAASAPDGNYIEIGTSAGYSTLWLTLACREVGRSITTFEFLPQKADLAEETFSAAGVENLVRLVRGDARDFLKDFENISFCFLDAEKETYYEFYELVIPRMVIGGLLVADNAISHERDLKPMLEMAARDERVDVLVVPIGKGEFVCRKR